MVSYRGLVCTSINLSEVKAMLLEKREMSSGGTCPPRFISRPVVNALEAARVKMELFSTRDQDIELFLKYSRLFSSCRDYIITNYSLSARNRGPASE